MPDRIAVSLAALMLAASGTAAEPQEGRAAFGHWGQVWGTWVWTTNNQAACPASLCTSTGRSASFGREICSGVVAELDDPADFLAWRLGKDRFPKHRRHQSLSHF